MIKAVIFDIGGVLAYDVWEHLLCDPPGKNPVSVASKFRLRSNKVWNVGQLLWKDYECRSTSNPADRDRYEAEYWGKFKEHFKKSAMLQATSTAELIGMTDPFIRPIKGMAEGESPLLEKLRKLQSDGEIVLAICSNNNAFWFPRQAARLNLQRFFDPDYLFLSHEAGWTKPKLLGMVVEKLQSDGITGDQCIFVDDRPKNVQDAVNLYQMTGILFPTDHREEGAEYLTALLKQKGLRI